jgi:hypothetical protein
MADGTRNSDQKECPKTQDEAKVLIAEALVLAEIACKVREAQARKHLL